MKTRPSYEELVEIARVLPEDNRVPYAFEKRVMALLQSVKPLDSWAVWSQTMWRSALAFIAITLLTGAFAQFASEKSEVELLASDLEQTVMAPITVDETW